MLGVTVAKSLATFVTSWHLSFMPNSIVFNLKKYYNKEKKWIQSVKNNSLYSTNKLTKSNAIHNENAMHLIFRYFHFKVSVLMLNLSIEEHNLYGYACSLKCYPNNSSNRAINQTSNVINTHDLFAYAKQGVAGSNLYATRLSVAQFSTDR